MRPCYALLLAIASCRPEPTSAPAPTSTTPSPAATPPVAKPTPVEPPFGKLEERPTITFARGAELRTRVLGKNLISAAVAPNGRDTVLVSRTSATLGPLGAKGKALSTRAVELGSASFSPQGTRVVLRGGGIELFAASDGHAVASTGGSEFAFLSEDEVVIAKKTSRYDKKTKLTTHSCSTDVFDARSATTTSFRDDRCRKLLHVDRKARRAWLGDTGDHRTTAGQPTFRAIESMDLATGTSTTIFDQAQHGPMIGFAIHPAGRFSCFFKGAVGEPGDGRYALFCTLLQRGAREQRIASDVRPGSLQLDPTRERLRVCEGDYKAGMAMRVIDLEAHTIQRYAASPLGCGDFLPGTDALIFVDDHKRIGAMVDLGTNRIHRAPDGEWDDWWAVPGSRRAIVGLERNATRDLVLWELPR